MKKYIFIVIICLSLVGCGHIYLSIITPKNSKKSLKIMKRGNQEIIFLPMIHLAKSSFFDQVTIIIDSLKKEGYTVFYEQISIDENQSIEIIETNIRKLRKMWGVNIIGAYNNKRNKSLPNFYKTNNYSSQNNIDLGIDSLDIIADVTLSELINAHEKKEGEIMLTKCDYDTNLNDKYKCKTVSRYYAIHTFRDSIAANTVLKLNKEKSVLIFGKAHWYGIWPFFRDVGYVLKTE